MNTADTEVSSKRVTHRRIVGRGWRFVLLALLALGTPLMVLNTPKTVNVAAVVSSALFVDGESISIDGGLIAYQQSPYGGSYIYVYDTVTDLYSSFAPPMLVSGDPIISGNKVVLVSSTTGLDWGIFYCTLQSLVPLGKCGPWSLIKYADHGINPGSMGLVFRGDIVAWARIGGFSYYRFSSGKVTNVTTPVPPPVSGSTVSIALSTNGALIAFSAKATRRSASYTVMYYNASSPSPTLADTGFPTTLGFISLSQDTIVFNDNSTTPANRIRYYNIFRNQASSTGTGPVGIISSTQSVSGDRVIFRVSEVDLASDCDGNGIITATEFCLRYWNIQNPAVLLSPMAAPGLATALTSGPGVVTLAISGKTLGYTVPTSLGEPMLVDVSVPVRGDADQDGVVDFLDMGIVGAAFLSTPGSPNWNPAADLDGDGVVNFLDLSIVGACFLRTLKNPC